ncbi:right-handed parallel beta-helix repeat-containing protein [Thermomonospora cellulosilytica]|uniref:Nitrous oxidase accessory protein NosD n=1 Tax=Thermomonospora cellulosilytica TaxID=1411118 RepID=A0A7W3N2Q4_9ACTN|nr:right-handed parallel beta-helix repeat-containing protein [Thermomonospora cellulosilytica]MBA9006476.1 nitrous oxidase accessory protein NosD [Thermomonospora cellulosilytica]
MGGGAAGGGAGRRTLAATLTLGLVAVLGAGAATAHAAPGPTDGPGSGVTRPDPATDGPGSGTVTPDPAEAEPGGSADPTPAEVGAVDPADAARQAALVDREDQRIIQTRAVLAAMLQIGGTESGRWKQPQIYGSAHGKTLVLPERGDGAAYTIRDLAAAGGGKYFRRLPDGSYLLGIHVFVADGAELVLESGDRPLVIRMGSIPGAFASVVGFGGVVRIIGTRRAPVTVTSWNAQTRRPDTRPEDGRAYIRAVGGEFEMEHAHVSHLGFWSGRTGGIALTGTDRPTSAAKHRTKEQRQQDKRLRMRRNQEGQGGAGGGPGDVELGPAGQGGGTASHVPAEELVTGSIENSAITGNAYGLFVSGSNQTQISGNRVTGSLVHGVLLHRFVKNATVENTTVTGSRGDGFVLSRATEKVRVVGCTAERNGRNGFTLNGQALAAGPSAAGEPLSDFGDSSVSGGTARGNARYGVELLGGRKLAVQGSRITGGDMGIVVRAGAADVRLSGNTLTGQRRHGIALRDGVTGAAVSGNSITGPVTGIYLRSSTGTIVGNTITVARAPRAHGISVLGDADGTQITSNTVRGSGTSAVHVSRAHGDVERDDNDLDGWHDTSTLWMKARRFVKPMNLVWAGVFLLVIVSMVRSRDAGPRLRRGSHPYAPQRRLDHRPAQVLQRRPHQPSTGERALT